MPNSQLTVVDLFAGAGGMSLGFRLAGYTPVAAVEYSPESATTYRHNHAKLGEEPLVFNEDIWEPGLENRVKRDLNRLKGIKQVAVLTAGLPCETFSVAQRKRSPNDRRNYLYHRVVDFVKELKPRVVLIENVVPLKRAWNGGVYEALKGHLEELGYGFTSCTLNAADFGVPQARSRLFMVAILRRSEMPEISPPKLGRTVSITEALADLPNLPPLTGNLESNQWNMEPEPGTYPHLMRVGLAEALGLEVPAELHNHRAQRHSPAIVKRFAQIGINQNLKDFVARTDLSVHARKPVGYTRHRRPDPTLPSYTVTAHAADELLHPHLNRILTPREAARLQSFPDWYEFKGPRSGHHGNARTQDWYEQIGDAVPPLLARALAEFLRPYAINPRRKTPQS